MEPKGISSSLPLKVEGLNCHMFLQHLKHSIFVSRILVVLSSFLYGSFFFTMGVLGLPPLNFHSMVFQCSKTAALEQWRWLHTGEIIL